MKRVVPTLWKRAIRRHVSVLHESESRLVYAGRRHVGFITLSWALQPLSHRNTWDSLRELCIPISSKRPRTACHSLSRRSRSPSLHEDASSRPWNEGVASDISNHYLRMYHGRLITVLKLSGLTNGFLSIDYPFFSGPSTRIKVCAYRIERLASPVRLKLHLVASLEST